MTNIGLMTISPNSMKIPELPLEYRQLDHLDLCGNSLEKIKVPLLFKNVPLLLIGSGIFPQVWLAGPENPDQVNWRWLVSKSISGSNCRVDIDAEAAQVSITLGGKLLLKVRASGANSAKVTKIDLRPLGMLIQGEEDFLLVGTTEIKANRFLGSEAAINIS